MKTLSVDGFSFEFTQAGVRIKNTATGDRLMIPLDCLLTLLVTLVIDRGLTGLLK